MKLKLTLKNISNLIFLIILLNFQTITFSQENKKQNPWIIKINTTALIDIFSFPTVQLAVEKKINNSFSVQTEVGYQLYDLWYNIDTTSVKVGGFKINTEGRFYLFNYFKNEKTKKRFIDGIYTGIQVFYNENKYNQTTQYYKSNIESGTYFTDNFGVIKKIYGTNLAVGFQKMFNQFLIEPYIYFGYRSKKVENINREFDPSLGHIEDNGPHDFFGHSDKEESSGNSANFSFGFRVGYQF